MNTRFDVSLDPAAKVPANERNAQGLEKAAREFETLFAKMMLKAMRDSVPESGMFPNSGGKLYEDMLDGEYAKALARGKGLGIADMLVQQLGAAAPAAPLSQPGRPEAAPASPGNFVDRLWPAMQKGAAEKGIAAEGMLAQAALETGWGRHVPCFADGRSSNNLFGIKAGSNWQGERIAKDTLEFENGQMVKKREWFRAYPSPEAAVEDYLRLLDTPRYAGVREAGSSVQAFADALQGSGYATDPEYADKIRRLAGSDALQGALAAFKQSGKAPITR